MTAVPVRIIEIAEYLSGRVNLSASSAADPGPVERLELGHIAKVIEQGHWSEP